MLDTGNADRWQDPSASPGRSTNQGLTKRAEGVFAEVLDQLDHGVMVLSATGHLLHMNRTAERTCAGHPVLHVDKNHLVAKLSRDNNRLTRAIQDAAKGLRTMICFDDQASRLALAVAPLRTPHTAEPPFGLVLALLAKRSGTEPLNIALFSQANGLTPSERDVLIGLSSGFDPSELTQRLGVSICTLRTHIAHIRQKTGSPHLRALMSLVHNLPPIVCSTERCQAE